jgi:hypothetical protein
MLQARSVDDQIATIKFIARLEFTSHLHFAPLRLCVMFLFEKENNSRGRRKGAKTKRKGEFLNC